MKFSKITRHLNMKDVNRKQLQKEKALKDGTLSEQPTMNTRNIYHNMNQRAFLNTLIQMILREILNKY